MVHTHGSYIHDLGAGVVDHIKDLTPDEAVELITEEADPQLYEEHAKVRGSLDPKDQNLMLNKGWIALRIEEDRVFCLVNHDNNYRLKTVPKECITKMAKSHQAGTGYSRVILHNF